MIDERPLQFKILCSLTGLEDQYRRMIRNACGDLEEELTRMVRRPFLRLVLELIACSDRDSDPGDSGPTLSTPCILPFMLSSWSSSLSLFEMESLAHEMFTQMAGVLKTTLRKGERYCPVSVRGRKRKQDEGYEGSLKKRNKREELAPKESASLAPRRSGRLTRFIPSTTTAPPPPSMVRIDSDRESLSSDIHSSSSLSSPIPIHFLSENVSPPDTKRSLGRGKKQKSRRDVYLEKAMEFAMAFESLPALEKYVKSLKLNSDDIFHFRVMLNKDPGMVASLLELSSRLLCDAAYLHPGNPKQVEMNEAAGETAYHLAIYYAESGSHRLWTLSHVLGAVIPTYITETFLGRCRRELFDLSSASSPRLPILLDVLYHCMGPRELEEMLAGGEDKRKMSLNSPPSFSNWVLGPLRTSSPLRGQKKKLQSVRFFLEPGMQDCHPAVSEAGLAWLRSAVV